VGAGGSPLASANLRSPLEAVTLLVPTDAAADEIGCGFDTAGINAPSAVAAA
jgi:hypothetical protein